jgi:transposase-like protein
MSRTRPPYPAEFRREAVSLLRSGARSTSRLAAELGCSEQTLRNWLRWYIECFYNTRRRHSSLGGISPTDYEQRYSQKADAA